MFFVNLLDMVRLQPYPAGDQTPSNLIRRGDLRGGTQRFDQHFDDFLVSQDP